MKAQRLLELVDEGTREKDVRKVRLDDLDLGWPMCVGFRLPQERDSSRERSLAFRHGAHSRHGRFLHIYVRPVFPVPRRRCILARVEAFFQRGGRVFSDRQQAGRELGEWFRRERPSGELLVLGLPRGGVPVAFEVARALAAPLDVFLVRKLGAPFNPEFAVGAIATGDVVVYNDEAVAGLGLDARDLDPIIARERAELARRELAYRSGRPPLALEKKTVILVDDGIATGSTMRAAVAAAKAMHAKRVIAAAPTASRQAVAELERSADLVAVLEVPEPYEAVGRWYEHFPQLTDQEVVALLSLHEQQRGRGSTEQLLD